MNESAVSFTLVLISDWLAICVLCYLLVLIACILALKWTEGEPVYICT